MAVASAPNPGARPRAIDSACLPSFVFVCTANRCRSPLAAEIARSHLAQRGLAAHISSYGLMSGGKPTPDTGIAVGAEHGLSLAAHRSTRLRGAHIRPDDLILTMTRAQAREVVATWPDMYRRVFTLVGFTELAVDQPAFRRVGFRDWVEFLGNERPRTALLGDGQPDEITDPMGHPAAVWREVAHTLDHYIGQLLTASSPLLAPPTSASQGFP